MKKAMLILLCALLLSTCTACEATNATKRGATFNHEIIYMDELRFYVYYSQYQFEYDAGGLIQSMFGSADNFWLMQEGEGTYFDRLVIEDATSTLQKFRIARAEAEKTGVALTEEETAKAEEAFAAFMDDPGNVFKYTGEIAEEKVHRYFLDKALAEKFEKIWSGSMDRTVDPALTLRKMVEGASVAPKQNAPGADGEETGRAYTEAEKKANVENALKEVRKMLDEGTAPLDIFDHFAESETVSVFAVIDKVIEPGKLDSDNDKELYFKDAWDLHNGEMKQFSYVKSDNTPITYIIRMLDEDNADERKKAEEKILKEREEEYLAGKLDELKKKYSFNVRKGTLPEITYLGEAFIYVE